MIVNIFFHAFFIIYIILNISQIENYLSLIISLVFSFLISINIVNFFLKKKMSLKGDEYLFHKDGKDKGVRLSIFIFCVIVEGIIILSFFKIIDLWPTGLK